MERQKGRLPEQSTLEGTRGGGKLLLVLGDKEKGWPPPVHFPPHLPSTHARSCQELPGAAVITAEVQVLNNLVCVPPGEQKEPELNW